MQAVLYISHGSRVEKARNEAVSLIQSVQERIDVPLQETCFLELAEPDVNQGIDRLVQRGATRIAIVPVLLLSAGHYYKDIPEEVDHAKNRHPHVDFVYGKPIGIQDRVIDILVKRVQEINVTRSPDSKILLVGRGSHHPETRESMEQIAAKLQAKMDVSKVDVCYLAACKPSFDDGLRASIREGWSQTFVIPYLWFTGILMRSMQKDINEIDKGDQQLILCQYLGSDPAMIEALTDRVCEALENEGQIGQTAGTDPLSQS